MSNPLTTSTEREPEMSKIMEAAYERMTARMDGTIDAAIYLGIDPSEIHSMTVEQEQFTELFLADAPKHYLNHAVAEFAQIAVRNGLGRTTA